MTDARELIKRLRNQALDRYAPKDMLREAADALSAALAREEALNVQIERFAEENSALRCISGGGCDANNDGPHNTIIALGKERFCNDCGETVNAHGKSRPWFTEDRLERAVKRINRAALQE